MDDRIQVTLENGVADVRLVRTDKMNALDDRMFQALVDTGERLKTEKGVRAIVLSGDGRAFCAGLDMGNFAKMASGERRGGAGLLTPERTAGGSNHAQHAVMVWREQTVPVIAAIHGVAFGGGFQLALGADIRFVTPDVRMAVLEIKWGLVPDMAGLVLMKRLVRDDVAREASPHGSAPTPAPTPWPWRRISPPRTLTPSGRASGSWTWRRTPTSTPSSSPRAGSRAPLSARPTRSKP